MPRPQNIVVLKLYKTNKQKDWYKFGSSTYDYYDQMLQLLVEDCRKYVIGMDKLLVCRDTVPEISDVFRQNGLLIKELWDSGSVNILYFDLDVVLTGPQRWFDLPQDHFLMNSNNCGVRWYGADMDPQLWYLFDRGWEDWDYEKYDYEQDVYISMMDLNLVLKSRITLADMVNNTPRFNYDDPKTHFINQQGDPYWAIHVHASNDQGNDTPGPITKLNEMKMLRDIRDNPDKYKEKHGEKNVPI